MRRKIKTFAVGLSKRSIVLRELLRWALCRYRKLKYALIRRDHPTDSKTVCFRSFNGKAYACSPKAIYEYMLTQERFKDYKFIWVFKEPEKYAFLEQNRSTTVVQDASRAYLQAMSTAKYWIHNYRVSDFIYPKADQVYVQCWHGTPLKKLGYDIEHSDNATDSRAEIRRKYRTDAEKFRAILSPSAFASEKFISAWDLKALGKENCVIEEGYPRNDCLFHVTADETQSIKKALGIADAHKKVILYAPTWRDDQHDASIGFTYRLAVDFDKLQAALGEEYIILFRAHYLVASRFDFEKYSGFVYDVSGYDDVNDLYIVSDLLVTDYSSVFFDYANLGRPMLFYMYDFDQYKNQMRDFYLDTDVLPGPIVQTQDKLIEAIRGLDGYFRVYGEKYRAFHDRFNALDDGHAAARVVDAILRL